MFNPSPNATNKGNAHKKAVAEVTNWVTDAITVNDVFHGEQFQVMVTEILCNEPDCAPIETLVIVILMSLESNVALNSKNSQKWANKILKPVAEVSKEDVQDLIQEVFLAADDDQPLTVDSNERFKLFEAELAALIHKYRPTNPMTNGVSPNDQNLIKVLQNQIDALKPSYPVTEKLSPVIPTPVEPVRTVTTVIMKPNVAKPVVVATAVAQSPETTPSVPAAVTQVKMAPSVGGNVSSYKSSATSTATANTPKEVVTPKETPQVNVISSSVPKPIVSFTPPDLSGSSATIAPRHKKGGTRPRGCPCCDPDNLDNIIDGMLFSHYPQT